jgi:hypothetical protein
VAQVIECLPFALSSNPGIAKKIKSYFYWYENYKCCILWLIAIIVEESVAFQSGDSGSPFPPLILHSLNSLHGPLGCDLRVKTSGPRLRLCPGRLNLRKKGLNFKYSRPMKCFSNILSASFSGLKNMS